jgi:hypothetical protein
LVDKLFESRICHLQLILWCFTTKSSIKLIIFNSISYKTICFIRKTCLDDRLKTMATKRSLCLLITVSKLFFNLKDFNFLLSYKNYKELIRLDLMNLYFITLLIIIILWWTNFSLQLLSIFSIQVTQELEN